MVAVVVSILGLAVILGLMTGGMTLCLFLWRRRWPRVTRVALAAFLGPASLMAIPLFMALFEGGESLGDMAFAMGMGAVFFGAIIGWPVAAFLTKRIDRFAEYDARVFD